METSIKVHFFLYLVVLAKFAENTFLIVLVCFLCGKSNYCVSMSLFLEFPSIQCPNLLIFRPAWQCLSYFRYTVNIEVKWH
jgi:hypothetical protein